MQIQKLLQQPRHSKYNNIHCVVNGIKFSSIKEAKRYTDLFYLASAGKITDLKLQVVFKIEINGEKVCNYKADFTYINEAGGYIVEDTKGMRTPIYNLKKRLLFLTQGISIKET